MINRQENSETGGQTDGQRGGNKHTWKDIVTDRQGGNKYIQVDRWKDIVTETY